MNSWWSAVDWHPIQGVFLPRTQYSQDRLGIQDEMITKMNK